MGQKVLWAERRSRRGWPRPARSTTGYGLCSFLNMADAPWVSRRWWFICPRTEAKGKLYLPNAAFTFAPECACGGGRATEWVYRLAAPRGVAIAPLAKSVRRALGVQRRKAA
jgi:hypothetical protein